MIVFQQLTHAQPSGFGLDHARRAQLLEYGVTGVRHGATGAPECQGLGQRAAIPRADPLPPLVTDEIGVIDVQLRKFRREEIPLIELAERAQPFFAQALREHVLGIGVEKTAKLARLPDGNRRALRNAGDQPPIFRVGGQRMFGKRRAKLFAYRAQRLHVAPFECVPRKQEFALRRTLSAECAGSGRLSLRRRQ